jgi:CBS domain containing-hemolysin-like protein
MSRVTRGVDVSEERIRGELGNAVLESSDELHSRRCSPSQIIWLIALGLLALPSIGQASMFHGETLDAIANGIAWVALVIAPVIGIAVFWLVHILPEKIAEKKKHPQTHAIQCLCLLSLCFGGLLWPIAWLWAYTKPVLHKMAYGTDVDESLGRHDEKVKEEEEDSVEKLRGRVAELEAKLGSHGIKA